jgi:DNA-binding MarR family transcriptional regulator
MHAMLVVFLAPMLAVSGIAGEADVNPDEELPDVEAQASARAEAAGAEPRVYVDADGTGPLVPQGLAAQSEDSRETDPGPLDEEDEADGGDEDQGGAEPAPMPSPEETATPAGLAVLGAAAYAALRWRYLLTGAFAPLYSRLSRDELLENETRNALHELIVEEPGQSTQELCDRVEAGWGNTVYHLQRLEQAGFVTSEKQGHHRRFYKNGDVEPADIEALGVLKNDNASKIARYLVNEPGSKQKEVCEALDISPSLAHKWISRLEEQDLVDSEREWRSKHYQPDERLEQLVEQAA